MLEIAKSNKELNNSEATSLLPGIQNFREYNFEHLKRMIEINCQPKYEIQNEDLIVQAISHHSFVKKI